MANFEYSIYALAHSLTRKEAKKVSVFLKDLGTDHATLQLELFETLRLSRSNDEQNLKSRLQSKDLIKYLSYHKGKLLDAILEVLSSSVSYEVKNRKKIIHELDKARVLHDRGFGLKAISKADKLLQDTNADLYPELHLLILTDLLYYSRNAAYTETQNVEECYQKVISHATSVATRFKLDAKTHEIFQFHANIRSTNNEELIQKVDELINDPIYATEPKSAGLLARTRYHLGYVFANKVKRKPQDVIDRLNLLLSIWDEHPDMIGHRTNIYGGIILNQLNMLSAEDKWQEFEELHKRASLLKSKSRLHQAEIEARLANLWLIYLLNRKFVIDSSLPLKIESIISTSEKVLAPIITVTTSFNYAVCLYVSNKTSKAKHWLSKTYSLKPKARYDLKGVSLILLTLLSISLNEAEYTQSMRRKIKAFPKKYPLDDTVFNATSSFLAQYAKANSQEQAMETIRSFDKSLPPIGGAQMAIIGVSEIRFWITSQLKGISIKEAWVKA